MAPSGDAAGVPVRRTCKLTKEPPGLSGRVSETAGGARVLPEGAPASVLPTLTLIHPTKRQRVGSVDSRMWLNQLRLNRGPG